MRTKICENCRAYDAPKGECHRHPVKPWPKMARDEWCEEHVAKSAPADGSVGALTEPSGPINSVHERLEFVPYYERNRARPYSAKSPDPDLFIRACAGGQPLKVIMQRLREAGEKAEKINLFACLNAARHLENTSWIIGAKGENDSAKIYRPGPHAIMQREEAVFRRNVLPVAEQITVARSLLPAEEMQAIDIGEWAEIASGKGCDLDELNRSMRAELLEGVRKKWLGECDVYWLPAPTADTEFEDDDLVE